LLISSLDRHFAREIGRVGGEERAEVLAAIALASRETAMGHSCLALDRLSHDDAWGELSTEFSVPDASVWRELLSSSPLVASIRHRTREKARQRTQRSPDLWLGNHDEFGDARPLVLDPAGRLYLRRYWIFQQQLADQLRKRAALGVSDLDETQLVDGLDRFFGPTKSQGAAAPRDDCAQASFDLKTAELDRQRLAAALAVSRKFAVISGGPGTGKTATAGKILALIVEQEMLRNSGSEGSLPRIALLAPTGKAAATLARAIVSVVASLACPPEVKAAIPTVARTIHRCLGVRGGALPEFRHHAGNPLPIDVLLVDEASMVDLALMGRLLSAVPDDARVILLGDEHQLASVEAGAVLGDICAIGSSPGYSFAFASRLSRWVGADVETAAPDLEPNEIRDSVARLTHSYRYGAESGIDALARAINRGDVSAALEILDGPDYPEVLRFDLDARGPSIVQLYRDITVGFRGFLAEPDPERMLERFSYFRVLSPQRKGPGGVEELNRQIEAVLRREKLIGGSADRYPGRPLMVKTNDYAQELFNGDVGIVIAGDAGGEAIERVIFHSETGSVRRLAYSRLPEHETAFAMTIHKSQGSEFDRVAVVLTDFASQRASRELLYTAVTRARSRVALYGSRDAIARAIGRKIERASGLGDALRSPTL
jgi:exodeoxyribonuclease V alpha subunit